MVWEFSKLWLTIIGTFRKTFLVLFCSISLAATAGFGVVAAVGPSVYLLAGLFAIISNVSQPEAKPVLL